MLVNNNRTEGRTQDHLSQPLGPTQGPIAATMRAQMVALLNQTLATTLDLKALLGQAPSPKGMNFGALVTELEAYVDLFTTWISALDAEVRGTTDAAVKPALAEELPDLSSIKDQVTALADHLVPYAKSLRYRIDRPEVPRTEQWLQLREEPLPAAAVPCGDSTAATGKVIYQHKSRFRRAISKGLIRGQHTQGSHSQVYYLPTSGPRQPPTCT